MMNTNKPTSIYVHIPFCQQRCTYCDFHTFAGMERLIMPYIDALCQEIEATGISDKGIRRIHTIFLGGGTPSIVPVKGLKAILDAIFSHFSVDRDAEISLEANPGTLTQTGLAQLRTIGFNRLSMGMQSAHVRELNILGRIHNWEDVRNAVGWAREAGFDNMNLDLIYGLPGQTIDDWQTNLEQALAMEPEHLSLYGLTIEEGTLYHSWWERGIVEDVDDEVSAGMYERARNLLEEAGYFHYEISNWAKKANRDLRCRHNMQYWKCEPYFGFGAGAHGYIDGFRIANNLTIQEYIEVIHSGVHKEFPQTAATETTEWIDTDTAMDEMMILGLRLVEEGVHDKDFREKFGAGIYDVYGVRLDKLLKKGLLQWEGEKLKLTSSGLLLGNLVFMEFLRG